MNKKEKDLYELRDLIADAIDGYQRKHLGTVVALELLPDMATSHRATVGQLSVSVFEGGLITAKTTHKTIGR